MALLMRPLTWALNFLQSVFDLGDHPQADEAPTPEEHIDALIAAGEEEGIIEKGDRELIQSVVAFGDTTVREVMTPRPRIVAIRQDASLEELREVVIHEQYSRIPVYEENIDQITGFVHVRDMFELDDEQRAKRKVRDIVRPIRAVPETKPVNDLLREMQEEGAHMAVVVDEYGSTAGIVTMEDMVEEIVGEIHDEHEPERDFSAQPDGSYVVSGSFDIGRLQDLLDFHPPEGTESTTVGGLVTEWLGHVPEAGETTRARRYFDQSPVRESGARRSSPRLESSSLRNEKNQTPGGICHHSRPPQRRQIHALECAARHQAGDRGGQAADHAHVDSRRADAAAGANRVRRHARHSQIQYSAEQAHDGYRPQRRGRARRRVVRDRRPGAVHR